MRTLFVTDLVEIICSFSKALDLSATGIANHHQTVSLLALAIAEQMGLEQSSRECVFLSALVHDAGVTSHQEMDELTEFEPPNPYQHCLKGYEIFAPSRKTSNLSRIILSHHDRWKGNNPSGLTGESIPLESTIICLADRVAVLAEMTDGNVLDYHKDITEQIKLNSGKMFNPIVVEAFQEISSKEALWLNLQPDFLNNLVRELRPIHQTEITTQELLEIAECFSQIIDNKSPFTLHHSRKVAVIAYSIAKMIGFSEFECQLMKFAGYVHDLGKIAIPKSILDKPSKLTEREYAVIKKHTYYTYHLIKNIPGLEIPAAWAAYHHEKLDGTGYPFGIKKRQLTLGSRIMAVADVFAALIEDRPYRPGLIQKDCKHLMGKMVETEQLDNHLVSLVKDNYEEFEGLIK
ncbi:MAG: HD-GYP domain-containing protein [Bacillota bacterium]